ncbi:enoyl-CoA hydratase-related protein [Bacillus subtilis]|nr:enoyl-CoA hydratase-related protein [Bacillus subtilis]MEC0321321.1 enoyl-CoA hydratase-related protein [Bacillus subtilis]
MGVKRHERGVEIVTSVVHFQELGPEIVLLRMQDQEHKNTFSKALIDGLLGAFEAIQASDTYKVVILTGYDTYFASGGTREGLLAIHEGREKFTDNFMKYGFTPGMGATCILPRKLGISLTEELLINSSTYRGAELEKRGIPFPVLPRMEVLDYAIDLAREIAEKPRYSLVLLKDHLVSPIRNELPAIIEKEVLMHEKTFHQPEVRMRINNLFGK